MATLDAALAHYAEVLEGPSGRGPPSTRGAPGAGAAGGIGYGALVGLGATFRPGIEVMLDVLGFAAALERADAGDHRRGLARRADPARQGPGGRRGGGPRGRQARSWRSAAGCALPPEALGGAGIRRAYALTDLEQDRARCMAEAGPLLERLAERLAEDRL